MKKQVLLLLMTVIFALNIHAQLPKVYNENINQMTQIDEAISKAKQANKFVVCQLGGNWCPWCLRFADFITKVNLDYYQDAYEIGYEKIIDTYAEATKHVDQGLSLTLFFPDTITTRDVNKAQIYAWRKGIKSLYYIRLRQAALEGTEVQGCVSCML